jgi:hypothetical protein
MTWIWVGLAGALVMEGAFIVDFLEGGEALQLINGTFCSGLALMALAAVLGLMREKKPGPRA